MKMNFKKLLGLLAIPFFFVTSACSAEGIVEKVYQKTCSHTYEHVDYKDSTCTEEGMLAHYHCTKCDYYFNENLEQTPYRSLVIGLKEHDYETIAKQDSTCTELGHEAYLKCKDCEHIEDYKVIDLKEHNYENKDGLAPTCTQDGYTSYKECIDCHHIEGKVKIPACHEFNDGYVKATSLNQISAGSKIYFVYKESDTSYFFMNATQDSSSKYFLADSSTTLDFTKGVCINVEKGNSSESFALNINGKYFNYSSSNVNLADSITNDSSWTFEVNSGRVVAKNVSANTQYIKFNASASPKRFKNYASSSCVWFDIYVSSPAHHEAKAPTCDNDGNIEYYVCSACHEVLAADKVTVTTLEAVTISKAHTNLTHYDAKPSTCLETGHKEYWYCSGCERYYSDAVASQLIDDFDAWKLADGLDAIDAHNITKHDQQAATYEAEGVKEYYTCSNTCCSGKKYIKDGENYVEVNDADLVIAKLHDHHLVETVQVNATCTSFGTKHYYQCDVAGCGEYFEDAQGNTPIADLDSWKEGTGKIAKADHDFSGDFDDYDKDGHWHICNAEGCDATDTPVAHTLNEDYECTGCAYKMSLTGDLTLVVGTYATANSWKNAQQVKTININDYITAKSVSLGASTAAAYYSNDSSWRIYKNDALSFESKAPYTIVSVKVTYTGTITGLTTDKAVDVNNTTCEFKVTANAKITQFVINYKIKTNDELVTAAKTTLTLEEDEYVANFYLPSELDGTSISWASNNAAITVATQAGEDGYLATVSQGANDVDVKLTATISKGTKSDTKEFDVKVLKLSQYSLTLPEIEHVSITQDVSSYTLASVNSGTTINFNVSLDDGWYFAEFKCGTEDITVSNGKFAITMTDNLVVTGSVLYYGTQTNPLTVDQAVALITNANLDNSIVAYVKGSAVAAPVLRYSNDTNIYKFDLAGTSKNVSVYGIELTDPSIVFANDEVLVKGSLVYSSGKFLNLGTTGTNVVSIVSIVHPQYSISVNSGNFTTTLPTTAQDNGSKVEFTVTPDSGYSVTSVTLNGTALTANEGTYSFNVSATNTIVVTVVSNSQSYTLTLPTASADGEVSVTPSDLTYSANTELTLTVTPATGKELDWLKVNGTEVTVSSGHYTFNINTDTEITVAFKDKASKKYVKVTDSKDLTTGKYLIVFEGYTDSSTPSNSLPAVAMNGSVDAAGNGTQVTIVKNEIAYSATLAAISFDVVINGSSSTIKASKYIGMAGNSNGLTCSDTAINNTISISGGSAVIAGAGGARLCYNKTSNQLRFRYYKTTSYSSQQVIQLYKLVEEQD